MPKKKIVSIEDRSPKLKQARKKKATRRLMFYLGIIMLLISFIVYLQSPLSHVREINVVGNSYLTSDTVQQWSGITHSDNFWTVDSEKVSEKILKHPEIDEASVSRKFLSTIEINVTEGERVGYLRENGKYYPLLANGNLLKNKQSDSVEGDAPILSDFKDNEYLTTMANELQNLPQSIFSLISEITWQPTEENPYKISLFMNDGYQVQGTIRNFSTNMQAYPSITAQLDPSVEGVIHIGVGAYFEASAVETEQDTNNEELNEEEIEGETSEMEEVEE